jgi:hypothetical protein
MSPLYLSKSHYGKWSNSKGEKQMKKLIVLATAILFVVGVGITAAVCADAPAGPIQVGNFGEKPVVSFDHAKHAGGACVDCHHNEADGNYKCSDCHKLEAGDAPKIKDAMHKKEVGTCWKCHNKKSPDVAKEMKCKDCHAE